jgi:polysaccharide biosynthesis transport protein
MSRRINFKFNEFTSVKDYFKIILNDWIVVSLLILLGISGALLYNYQATEYYKSTTSIKVSKNKGDILTAPMLPEFTDFGNDRFIANEIAIMKSQNTLKKVASAIRDSVENSRDLSIFRLLTPGSDKASALPLEAVVGFLSGIDIEQKTGLDIIDISFLSPSPEEAALIVNTFAEIYIQLNKELNQRPMTIVREYLQNQKREKEAELNNAEEDLRNFRSQGKVFSLSEQASVLINQLAELDAQKNVTSVDYVTSEKVLTNLKQQLKEQDPRLADYLKSLSSQNYIKALQDEIVKLELNREIAQSRQSKDNPVVIAEYNSKIDKLKKELEGQLEIFKVGIFSSSPEDVKQLSQKLINEELKKQSLEIKLDEIEKIIQNYELSFNKLPKTSLELARFERSSSSLEKLYNQVEQRYQEALINEKSQPGNIVVIEEAVFSDEPARPNKRIIFFAGLALGIFSALGFVFIKNYLDDRIKTPEEIERSGLNVLGWIERGENNNVPDFGVNGTITEAFRTLRNRIQHARNLDPSLKTIMITSSVAGEGKSTVASYLAYSFSQIKQKVLVIDADMRRPRINKIFNIDPAPGLTEYFSDTVDLKDLLRATTSSRLQIITAGKVSEGNEDLWDISLFSELLNHFRNEFDIIIIDSAPIVIVPETESLGEVADCSILIISSGTVEQEVILRAAKLLNKVNKKFLGTILNKFRYRAGYSNYYKYTYSYSAETQKK